MISAESPQLVGTDLPSLDFPGGHGENDPLLGIGFAEVACLGGRCSKQLTATSRARGDCTATASRLKVIASRVEVEAIDIRLEAAIRITTSNAKSSDRQTPEISIDSIHVVFPSSDHPL